MPFKTNHVTKNLNTKAVSRKQQALWFAKAGERVVPLWWVKEDGRCACGNPNCATPGKHPIISQWQEKASNDPSIVSQWWSEYPQANIAILLEGRVAVDLDRKNNEEVFGAWARFLEQETGLGISDLGWWLTETPNDGLHYLFRLPEGKSLPFTTLNHTHGLPQGVEIHTGTHLLIMPSSEALNAETGEIRAYKFNDVVRNEMLRLHRLGKTPQEIWQEIIPEALKVFLQLCLDAAKGKFKQRQQGIIAKKSWDDAGNEGEKIPEGNRHNYLVHRAGRLRAMGFSPEAIEAALLVENQQRCDPPLPDKEVIAIARSMGKYPPRPNFDDGGDGAGEKVALSKGNGAGGEIAIVEEGGDNLPLIIITNNIPQVSEQAWKAIRRANEEGQPFLFSFKKSLVCLEANEDGRLEMIFVDVQKLLHLLRRCAKFVKYEGGKLVEAKPTIELAQDMLNYSVYPVPAFKGLIDFPIYVPDEEKGCRLLNEYGYDRKSGFFLDRLSPLPLVPEKPTDEEVQKAKEIIWQMLEEFPFQSQADIANTYALIILPFVRYLIDGPTPLHLITAPTKGVGKSLLAEVILSIPSDNYYDLLTERNEEEWRKTITSALLSGKKGILLDNLYGLKDNAPLAAALTTGRWSDRLLGRNEIVTLAQDAVWVATANNPQVNEEFVRRCVHIRLEQPCEDPYEREFKKPYLMRWVRQNRPRLWWAILTLTNNWIAQGSTEWKGKPLGRFEDYTAIIGGILEANGIQGFLDNHKEFAEMVNPEKSQWRYFVSEWWEQFGDKLVTTAELLPIAKKADLPLKGETDKAQATSLGMLLAKRCGQIFGGLKIVQGDIEHGRRRWRLERVRGNEDNTKEKPNETVDTIAALADILTDEPKPVHEGYLGEFRELSPDELQTFFAASGTDPPEPSGPFSPPAELEAYFAKQEAETSTITPSGVTAQPKHPTEGVG